MADYGTRVSRAIGASDKAFGGAGLNLPSECLAGEGDMVGVFDDFNDSMSIVTFGNAAGDADTSAFTDNGWVMTDVGTPANEEVSMNDPADVSEWSPSCIRIATGDTEDTGGNMQLDLINADLASGANHLTALSQNRSFPHLWIPETAAGVAVLDNTTWVFACRVGLRADRDAVGSGAWDSKAFIGWSVAGEGAIMTPSTGVLAVASAADQLVGFHIPEDGSIDGISQRVGTTAYAAGTNFTELVAASGVDGTVANGAATAGNTMWFDLALRMDITDHSATSNGATQFFHRGPLRAATNGGADVFDQPGQGYQPWITHPTVLTDQVPLHTVSLVPSIEVINGPTADTDGVFLLDWWTFGCSRLSRLDR